MGTHLSQFLDTADDKLKAYTLIWLDANVCSSRENQEYYADLQQVFRNVKVFEKSDQCEEYIKKANENEKIILIVSGQLGQQIAPLISSYNSLVSIYVYCRDLEKNLKWAAEYNKVI